MLIVEIILTVVAWKKGWNTLALLPLSASLFIGFFVGASGLLEVMDLGDLFAVDIACVGVLVAMILHRTHPVSHS